MPPNFLIDSKAILVADASVAINLIASGFAREILQSIPNKVVLTEIVFREILGGAKKGRDESSTIIELVNEMKMEIIKLTPQAEERFEDLVVGDAASTLDDGEASTIAHAVENLGIAIIDEKKAYKICGEKYPYLRIGSSLDLFFHPSVQSALGKINLSISLENALRKARMRVLPHFIQNVVGLIGPDKAAEFKSLPRIARNT